jgi:alginate O-acetyltransferase complex protein AlgI
MFFNSTDFVLFFLIVWLIYLVLKRRAQNVWLLAVSYLFYGWWDWRFLSLLFISTIVDFNCARAMERFPSRKKWFLLTSLVTNLGILASFKYFNFFTDSAIRMLNLLHFDADMPTLSIILPVGISFYTFQTMAYTIDVYRGKEKATSDLLSFSLYVAYFPQLVAGPIERSTHLLPQFKSARKITKSDFHSGSQLILTGYLKKVFLADGVAPLVDNCFNNPEIFTGTTLLCGVYLFAIQIYGDFAGYTDIARGVSRLLGIDLCLNFRQPYLASNITEFWRRWHISLSSWLRDYLYIPLGGNRKGTARTYANNLITMLLGGLWHGAAWTFVIWGALHGIYLAVHKLILGDKKVELTPFPHKVNEWIKWVVGAFVTFHLVCLAWIFFRADNLPNALAYLKGISHLGMPSNNIVLHLFIYGFVFLVIDVACWYQQSEVPFPKNASAMVRGLAYAVVLFLIFYVGGTNAQAFIYFQF